MTHVVPLIRAGALAPVVRWMMDHGRPAEEVLRAAGLGPHIAEDPFALVPVRNGVELLVRLARSEGPDIHCRIAAAIDIAEIGALGAVARERPTPRRALCAVAAMMPHHSTHEYFVVQDTAWGLRVSDSWAFQLDPESLHFVQQYVAALVAALCAATGLEAPLLERVEITPHPVFGIEHLRRWLGRVEPATTPRLVIDVSSRVADARLHPPGGGAPPPPSDWSPLRAQGHFGQSLRWTIAAMIGPGTVSVDRVAAAAGMTRRTLQRRLAEEGLVFSDLLDDTRRELASRLLKSDDLSIGDIAARLGYANTSALTRAVRRWTGATPESLRGGRGLLGTRSMSGANEDGAKG